jgi:hypothetical protein
MLVRTGILQENVSPELLSDTQDYLNPNDQLTVQLLIDDIEDSQLSECEYIELKKLLYTVGSVSNSLCHINPDKLEINVNYLLETEKFFGDKILINADRVIKAQNGEGYGLIDYLSSTFGSKATFISSLNTAVRNFALEQYKHLYSLGVTQIKLPTPAELRNSKYYKENEFMFGYEQEGKTYSLNIILNNSKYPCINPREMGPFSSYHMNFLLVMKNILSYSKSYSSDNTISDTLKVCQKFCRNELMSSTMLCTYLASKDF